MPVMFVTLRCPDCGKNITDTDVVCPRCGVELDAPLEETERQELAQPYLEKAKNALEAGKNLKGALLNCNEAIAYIPESAEAHNLRGLILDVMGKTDESILAYREALRLDPDFADAKENLAELEAEEQNTSKFDHQQKTGMTKGKAIIVGLFTAWPLLYIVLFMWFFMTVFSYAGRPEASEISNLFKLIIPLHLGTMLESFVLLAYYIFHLYNTTTIAENKKALWAVILFFGNYLAMPVYWYLYMWKPIQRDTSA
jgi:tetratricopeptide (TPR) repeat protein